MVVSLKAEELLGHNSAVIWLHAQPPDWYYCGASLGHCFDRLSNSH
ncbi:hypothetical protein AAULR_08635, partial [Lacticaseibacillus rhamnosus MTCC 5462]